MAWVPQNWGEILRTQNLSPERAMDIVSRWLLITRASAIPITLMSGAIGGLLAANHPSAHWGYFTMALIGLVLAHAAGNMIKDYLDQEAGVDEAEYARTQNAPHPILSGLISKTGLITAIAVVILMALAILLLLTDARGWPVAAFALLGLFISVGYAAPPLQIQYRGLGEPGFALVWGPLMIGGSYFATTGRLEPWVVVASLPYSLLVATVLIGKRLDMIEEDTQAGIQTLPVVTGVDRALFLNQLLMVSFFIFVVCLILVGRLGVATLIVLGALPSLWKALRLYSQPRPASAPLGHSAWPLWYAASAFSLTRLTGGLFVLGLVANLIYPLYTG